MRQLLAFAVLLALTVGASAQDAVHFASLDGAADRAPARLDGDLFKPNQPGPMPAVVFLHGCGGLISATSHRIVSREMDWAAKLNAQGIVVLMVDSFTPRGSGEMCSHAGFKEWLHLRRPADAYGALACKALVDRAMSRGAPITWQAYPDAYHDFDWPGLKRRELTAYATRAGVVPITAGHPASHAEAIRRVQGFLAQTLLN